MLYFGVMSDASLQPLQFDLETVREVAQLLRENELGEICLETTTEGAPAARLRMRRAAAPIAASRPPQEHPASTPDPGEDTEIGPILPATFTITSMAVGVFREAKVPLRIGDEIKARQVVGCVESLRVPNEIVAPIAGRVLEISTQDGQGIEYGQTLFVIEEI